MKDIGLGILDPYTVAIVFVTLALSQVFFGYQIPLDTTNAIQTFISLILFTGYLYAARSLLRLPIAAVMAARLVNKDMRITDDFRTKEKGIKKFKFILKNFLDLLRHARILVGSWLLITLDFSNEAKRLPEVFSLLVRFGIAIVDRLGLIAITFLATLPQFKPYFQNVSIVGLVIMAVLYVFKGNFAALLSDSLQKEPESSNNAETSSPSRDANEKEKQARQIEFLKNMEQARENMQPNRGETTSTEPIPGKDDYV